MNIKGWGKKGQIKQRDEVLGFSSKVIWVISTNTKDKTELVKAEKRFLFEACGNGMAYITTQFIGSVVETNLFFNLHKMTYVKKS